MLTSKTTEPLPIRKPSPRLKAFDYEGNYCYFVTCCTHQGNLYFKDKTVVAPVLDTLKEVAQKEAFTIMSYCFMPDHLHLLLSGDKTSSLKDFMQGLEVLSIALGESGDKTSSLKDFMRAFKQKSSFHFKKTSGKALWQRSYYDHILRKEEDIRGIALYIFRNPIRKGLASRIRDYPFLGSDVFDCNLLEEDGQT